jgi:hypothetical protein
MCIAIGANNRLRWLPLAAMSGPRPTFSAPWNADEVAADFRARVAFFDSILLDEILSEDERDELGAQRDVYKTLTNLGEAPDKADLVAWLSDALAEHLTTSRTVRRAYSLSHLQLINELTDAVFAS